MTGAYNRDVSIRKAIRKKKISDRYFICCSFEKSYYDNLHQYSKNKIHCSCAACSKKSKNKGKRRRGNYDPVFNYKASDLRHMDDMDQQEEELFDFS